MISLHKKHSSKGYTRRRQRLVQAYMYISLITRSASNYHATFKTSVSYVKSRRQYLLLFCTLHINTSSKCVNIDSADTYGQIRVSSTVKHIHLIYRALQYTKPLFTICAFLKWIDLHKLNSHV